jgi:hypothetical protein
MTDFVAIGNEELGVPIKAGDLLTCPGCREFHPIKESISEKGSTSLQYVACMSGSSYIVGVNGKLWNRS